MPNLTSLQPFHNVNHMFTTKMAVYAGFSKADKLKLKSAETSNPVSKLQPQL